MACGGVLSRCARCCLSMVWRLPRRRTTTLGLLRRVSGIAVMSSSGSRSRRSTGTITGSMAPARVWLELNRQGIPVARCTVERLMGELGLRGARRGGKVRTTRSDPAAKRPPDRVHRNFAPRAPNQLGVADFSSVSTWAGMVYVAFVIDAYARRILGWRVATSMTTILVLDALEHAVWTRRRDGATDLAGLIHHSDAGSQPGFKRSMQHRFAGVRVGGRSMPRQAFPAEGLCGVGC